MNKIIAVLARSASLRLAVAFGSVVTVLIIIYVDGGNGKVLPRIGVHFTPIVTILSLSMILVSSIIYYSLVRMEGEVDDFVVAGKLQADAAGGMIRSLVKALNRPLVEEAEGSEAIAERAAELIRSSGNPDSRDVSDGYKIIFLGAVGMQVGSRRNMTSEDDKKIDPSMMYHGALEEMSSNSVPVARVICLLSTGEYKARSKEIRDRYRAWLSNQKSQMQRNESFSLYDCPRAPKWGDPNASILTAEAVVSISGRGGVAYIVRDPSIPKEMAKSIFGELHSASRLNIKIFKKDKRTDNNSLVTLFDINSLKTEIEKFEKIEKGEDLDNVGSDS